MIAPSERVETYGFVWSEEGVAKAESETKYVADADFLIAPLQIVLDANRTTVMTSEASQNAFKARLLEELFYGVDPVQMAVPAAVRNNTVAIKAHGEKVMVEMNFNVRKGASAEIQAFYSSMTKAVKKCEFCLVFEGELLCAHGKDAENCATPTQCANNPCRSDAVCKPSASASNHFFCACPTSFSVTNCTVTDDGQPMMPELTVDSTRSDDSDKGQLSPRDVAIIIVIASLIIVTTLLLVRFFKPPNREKFTSDFGNDFNNDFNAAFSPVFSPNGVPIVGQRTLEWEEEVWDTPGHKNGQAKANPVFRDSVRKTKPHLRQLSSTASDPDSNYVESETGESEAGSNFPSTSVATSEGYTDFDDLAPFATWQNQLVWDNHYDPNTQLPICKERNEPGFTRTESDHTAVSSNASLAHTARCQWPSSLQQMGDDIFHDMSAASIAAHLHEGTLGSSGSKQQTSSDLSKQPTPKTTSKLRTLESASTLNDYIHLGEYEILRSPKTYYPQDLEHAGGLVVGKAQKSGHVVVSNEGLARGGTHPMMDLCMKGSSTDIDAALDALAKTAKRPKETAGNAGSSTDIDSLFS